MLKTFGFGLLLSSTTLPGFAQDASPPGSIQVPHYQYCILQQYGNDWHLDYGQQAKPAVVSDDLRQEEAAISKMGSEVAALNYLDSRGWEYVNRVTYSGNTFSGRTTYLLRRRIY